MFTQDSDLKNSIGKYKLKVAGARALPDGSMLLDLRIDDRYDFDEYRDFWGSVSNALNNVGFIAQEQGGLMPYDFAINFKYIYDPGKGVK